MTPQPGDGERRRLLAWLERANELCEYIDRNDALPPAGTRESNWLRAQRSALAKGTLDEQRVLYLDTAIPRWRRRQRDREDGSGAQASAEIREANEVRQRTISWQSTTLSSQDPLWASTAVALALYVNRTGRLPPADHPLGDWLERQRTDAGRKSAKWTQDRTLYLDGIAPGWRRDLGELSSHIVESHDRPEGENPVSALTRLQERETALELRRSLTTPASWFNWTAAQLNQDWHETANALAIYVHDNNSFPPAGHPLEAWLVRQRAAARGLGSEWTAEQQRYLDTIAHGWERISDPQSSRAEVPSATGPREQPDARWKANADELARFIGEHGAFPHPGHRLYNWLSRQRDAARGLRGAWTAERQQYLDATIPGWSDRYHGRYRLRPRSYE